MKYLNLTKGFNPFNAKEEDLIKFESFFFNGGEPHIKIDINSFDNYRQNVCVTSRLSSMNDFGMLMVATEALFQSEQLDEPYLFIPYFPGGRQDRRMVKGEPLTSKVFATIINDMGYDNVTTYDNHSEVSTALLDNCTDLNNHNFVNEILLNDGSYEEPCEINIISPDSGANKKVKDLCKQLSIWNPNNDFNIIKCDKTRNVKTGNITGFEVYKDELDGSPCYIIDDICDGGGTFIGLAKELRKKGAGDLHLIVSHGIFSKGFDSLNKEFKSIHTTNSFYTGNECNIWKIDI